MVKYVCHAVLPLVAHRLMGCLRVDFISLRKVFQLSAAKIHKVYGLCNIGKKYVLALGEDKSNRANGANKPNKTNIPNKPNMSVQQG